MNEREIEELESNATGDTGLRSGSRRLMLWFFIAVAANVAGLIWLSVRANSPTDVRTALDFLFQIATGAAVAIFAFRTLVSYPFLTSDLFGMVLVLAAWAKFTVDTVRGFSQLGFVNDRGGAHMGTAIQFFLLSASVLVAGAALGLWACQRLKIDRPLARLIRIVPAMLALPAAAGCAAFLVLALGEFSPQSKSMSRALLWIVLWFAAVTITILNAATFIRALALRAEIEDQAKI